MTTVRLKNVFGEPFKQAYCDLKINPKPTAFSPGMAASNTHIAFPWEVGGGGLITLINIDKLGRNSGSDRMNFKGHTGSIQDITFNEFDNNLFASASDDGSVRVWRVTGEQDSTAAANLNGHTKKTTNVVWNSATDFVLMSGGLDNTVRVWNVQNETEVVSIPIEGQYSYCNWSYDGDLCVVATKEAGVAVVDPREGKVSHSFKAHESNKATSVAWLGGNYGNDHLATTGYVGNQTRQIRIWDRRNTDKPLLSKDIDSAPGPLIPHWDSATGLLTVVGKGDLTVRIFQYLENELNRAGEIKCSGTIKSFCFLPATACDKSKCELGRMLYNNSGKEINPISVVVMRRNSGAAMDEIYGALQPRRRTSAKDWHNVPGRSAGVSVESSLTEGSSSAAVTSTSAAAYDAQSYHAAPSRTIASDNSMSFTPTVPTPPQECETTATGRAFGEICASLGVLCQKYKPTFDDADMIDELETFKGDVECVIAKLRQLHNIPAPAQEQPQFTSMLSGEPKAPVRIVSRDEGRPASGSSGLSGVRAAIAAMEARAQAKAQAQANGRAGK
ncbi:WD domain, G-beta repeat containing protein, putative [Babesia bigemina]|uniref:Coronin n=1 Tax=Babesia bigemina TaxID=5866 RepID=A0A061DDE4_BABBI|nr:WD domain, G-beta repeat containing protein, putative [Babesia bigemina]CDR97314.1 WD domain, G-beta repeat containing protein, putative [Babesia bigemina]|eukprot:XP_012769500.1 WD domain, G-beta repeat containing protein, putative [Babesia bigemina]